MRFFFSSLVLVSMLLGAAPAAAQVAGNWHVNGKIDDKAFVLDCRFDPNDSGFGGVCIEEGERGRDADRLELSDEFYVHEFQCEFCRDAER